MNKPKRYLQNVAGSFSVNTDCIDCDRCQQIAPKHFKRNDDKCHAYVGKQPITINEKQDCFEALESCPVGAISSK